MIDRDHLVMLALGALTALFTVWAITLLTAPTPGWEPPLPLHSDITDDELWPAQAGQAGTL